MLDHTINIGDYWLRPAWKAVHIACDVGNRVHSRNDSDEDVRGNSCKNDSLEGFTLVFHYVAHGYHKRLWWMSR